MKKYKVRFHLAKGKNYESWRVEDLESKEIKFYRPQEVSLEMKDCFLKNLKKTAQKIQAGRTKMVCAWVECSEVNVLTTQKTHNSILNEYFLTYKQIIHYNPKNAPYWILEGKDVDGTEFDKLITINNKVHTDVKLIGGGLQRKLF